MAFQITKQRANVFSQCSRDSLDPKTTELVRFAAQLAAGNEHYAKASIARAKKAGVSSAELSRAACLAARSAGPRVTATFANISGKEAHALHAAQVFAECSVTTFDDRTHYLVSLAVSLVTHCACAAWYLLRLKGLKIDEASVHRAACIAANEGGRTVKYAYLGVLASAAP